MADQKKIQGNKGKGNKQGILPQGPKQSYCISMIKKKGLGERTDYRNTLEVQSRGCQTGLQLSHSWVEFVWYEHIQYATES